MLYNSKDYSQEAIEELVKTHDAQWVKGVAGYANMYVFCRGEKIIGVGSISSFWGSQTESILLYRVCIARISWKENWTYHYQNIGTG